QMQGRTPGPAVGLGIDADRQLRQVSQRAIPDYPIVALPADPHLQDVGYFQLPQAGNPGPFGLHAEEEFLDRRSGFFGINPRQRSRTIEHETHHRPASRSAFRDSQLKGPSCRLLARARMRSMAACALPVVVTFPAGRPQRASTALRAYALISSLESFSARPRAQKLPPHSSFSLCPSYFQA